MTTTTQEPAYVTAGESDMKQSPPQRRADDAAKWGPLTQTELLRRLVAEDRWHRDACMRRGIKDSPAYFIAWKELQDRRHRCIQRTGRDCGCGLRIDRLPLHAERVAREVQTATHW